MFLRTSLQFASSGFHLDYFSLSANKLSWSKSTPVVGGGSTTITPATISLVPGGGPGSGPASNSKGAKSPLEKLGRKPSLEVLPATVSSVTPKSLGGGATTITVTSSVPPASSSGSSRSSEGLHKLNPSSTSAAVSVSSEASKNNSSLSAGSQSSSKFSRSNNSDSSSSTSVSEKPSNPLGKSGKCDLHFTRLFHVSYCNIEFSLLPDRY